MQFDPTSYGFRYAAIGADKDMPYASLASFEGVVPKTTDWRTLGVAPQETVAAK